MKTGLWMPNLVTCLGPMLFRKRIYEAVSKIIHYNLFQYKSVPLHRFMQNRRRDIKGEYLIIIER